jgi:F420-dependent oxidoreductase-like protein
MRIGLSGTTNDVDRTVEQAKRAEADGFSTIWYAGAGGGDPLLSIAFAGRATKAIELGTSIVQTYPVHPVHQASRAAAVATAIGREGFTFGIGPSHQPVIEGMYGMSYAHAGRHTEEYVRVLGGLLKGEEVDVKGEDFRVRTPGGRPAAKVSLLISALAPRMLRVAGELTDGTILWMGNARSIESHVAPRIRAAAERAGRPAPRIVAGLPVVVHDDAGEAREAARRQFAGYGALPNYQRILAAGNVDGPGDAAIVGDEASVASQIEDLFGAGATDVWAAMFTVGEDASASRSRTRAMLKELASRP